MTGRLARTPAQVFVELLIDLGLGDRHDDASPNWPIRAHNEVDGPDELITCFNTDPIHEGRFQVNGQSQTREGITVQIRSTVHSKGYDKANEIAVALDEEVRLTEVPIPNTSEVYLVYSVDHSGAIGFTGNTGDAGGPDPLGKQIPSSKRHQWNINCNAVIIQTS